MMPLPALLQVSEIQERLQVIFPQGTPNRNYVTQVAPYRVPASLK